MGGVGLIFLPALASAQEIEPTEPDPHEVPATPFSRQVHWDFTESGPTLEPSFATRQGTAAPGRAPMFGKIEFVDDYQTVGCPVVSVNGNAALRLLGDKLRFLPVVDFRGTAELDYLNYPNFFLQGEDKSEWLNGWDPGDVIGNPTLDVTRFQVARDGHLACGAGSRSDYPSPGHMNAGYNPLHPHVRSRRILEIVEDLGQSLRPFMAGSSYLPTASVQNIGLTMSERTRTCLLMHPNMGNIWDGTYPITSAK